MKHSRQFLEKQHALQPFRRTITDRITLLPGRERPRPFTPMPVRLPKVFRILLNLTLVEPLEQLGRRGVVLGSEGEVGFVQRLGDESRVPELGTVRPRHQHAVLGHPHCGFRAPSDVVSI